MLRVWSVCHTGLMWHLMESQIFKMNTVRSKRGASDGFGWKQGAWDTSHVIPSTAPHSPQAPTPVADTFLQYRTSKVRALRAARLERLVHELVSGDREQDPGFVPAFLATHQAFVPTARVLGFLLPPPPPPPPPGSVILRRLPGPHFRTPSAPPAPRFRTPEHRS